MNKPSITGSLSENEIIQLIKKHIIHELTHNLNLDKEIDPKDITINIRTVTKGDYDRGTAKDHIKSVSYKINMQ